MPAIRHRGPDAEGIESGPTFAIGHARLSIVGFEHGKQPMLSADRRHLIAFNGEIYNYREVAEDLRKVGHASPGLSDTEVVLSAYRTFGPSCLDRFQGMFAFVILDTESNELFAARDRFGIKPLYYSTVRTGAFLFASEIRPLLKLGNLPFSPDYDSFDEFLIWGYAAGTRTMHRNVTELAAGHWLRCKDGKVETQRYWYPVNGEAVEATETEAIALVETELKKAVSLYGPEDKDVPVFSLLSGGLDSSLVTKLLSDECSNVTAITAYFPDDPETDERHLTAHLLRQLKISASELPISDSYIFGNFERLVGAFDEPIHDANSFTLMSICEAIKKEMPGVKIVFCGEGSDEIFAGYARHRSIALEFEEAHDPMLLYYAMNRVALPRLRLFTNTINDRLPDRLEILRGLRSKDAQNMVLEQDQLTFLTAYLHRQDVVGMRFALEFRTPFLEHALTDLVNRLPSKFKANAEWRKFILRKVAEKHIPGEIIWNKKKYQFTAPISRMMRSGPLREKLESRLGEPGLFAGRYWPEGVRALLEKHDPSVAGEDHGNTLFRLLTLDSWLRSF